MSVGGYDCSAGEAGRTIPADNVYFLTSFGGGSDTQPMACGGPIADGSWWYCADKSRYPCGTLLLVTNPLNSRSCIVKVADYGPNICVEQAGGGPVLDASPLVSQYLFNRSGSGYEDHARVVVNIAPDQSALLGPTDLIARIGTNWLGFLTAGLAGLAAWAGYKAWSRGELRALGLPGPRRNRR